LISSLPLGGQVSQVLKGPQVWWALAAQEIFFVDGCWVVNELKDSTLCTLADFIKFGDVDCRLMCDGS
jgi:hypothetical protein